MRIFLKWLVSFLDRKFPEKVTVTKSDYDNIRAVFIAQGEAMSVLRDEVSALKGQMANVNHAMGFSAPKMGMLER